MFVDWLKAHPDDDVRGALGGLDVLVNNVGIVGPTGPIEKKWETSPRWTGIAPRSRTTWPNPSPGVSRGWGWLLPPAGSTVTPRPVKLEMA